MSYRAMGDNISSSIWKHLSKFDSRVEDFFQKQFFPINCIPIGLEGNEIQMISYMYLKTLLLNHILTLQTWRPLSSLDLLKGPLKEDYLEYFNTV